MILASFFYACGEQPQPTLTLTLAPQECIDPITGSILHFIKKKGDGCWPSELAMIWPEAEGFETVQDCSMTTTTFHVINEEDDGTITEGPENVITLDWERLVGHAYLRCQSDDSVTEQEFRIDAYPPDYPSPC
jgi:hypothetical protein